MKKCCKDHKKEPCPHWVLYCETIDYEKKIRIVFCEHCKKELFLKEVKIN